MSLPTTGQTSSSVSQLTTRNPNTPEVHILQSQERKRIGVMNSSIIPLFVDNISHFLMVKLGLTNDKANYTAVSLKIINLLIKSTYIVFFEKRDPKEPGNIQIADGLLEIILKFRELSYDNWRLPVSRSSIEELIQKSLVGKQINGKTDLRLLNLETGRSLEQIRASRASLVLLYEEIAQKEKLQKEGAVEECGVEFNSVILKVLNELAYSELAEHFVTLKRIAACDAKAQRAAQRAAQLAAQEQVPKKKKKKNEEQKPPAKPKNSELSAQQKQQQENDEFFDSQCVEN